MAWIIIDLLHTYHLLDFLSFTIAIVEPIAYNIPLHPSFLPPLLPLHLSTALHYCHHHHSLPDHHLPNTLHPALTTQLLLLLDPLVPPLRHILLRILLLLARSHLHLAPLKYTITIDQDPIDRFILPFIFFTAFKSFIPFALKSSAHYFDLLHPPHIFNHFDINQDACAIANITFAAVHNFVEHLGLIHSNIHCFNLLDHLYPKYLPFEDYFHFVL